MRIHTVQRVLQIARKGIWFYNYIIINDHRMLNTLLIRWSIRTNLNNHCWFDRKWFSNILNPLNLKHSHVTRRNTYHHSIKYPHPRLYVIEIYIILLSCLIDVRLLAPNKFNNSLTLCAVYYGSCGQMVHHNDWLIFKSIRFNWNILNVSDCTWFGMNIMFVCMGIKLKILCRIVASLHLLHLKIIGIILYVTCTNLALHNVRDFGLN